MSRHDEIAAELATDERFAYMPDAYRLRVRAVLKERAALVDVERAARAVAHYRMVGDLPEALAALDAVRKEGNNAGS